MFLVLVTAAGVAYYLRIESLRSAAREETIRKDLEQPRNLALKEVQNHDEVKAALGEPVEQQGNLWREGTGELDRSNAVFSFEVGGPNGKAVVDATAKQEDGSWRVVDIKVNITGGKTIAVPPPEKAAVQELDFNL